MATPPPGRSGSPFAGNVIGEDIPVAELLPELWALVLGRLPVKFLLRSRCVSKTWRSIIDNPNFIQLHSDLRNRKSDNNFVLAWESRMTELGPPLDKLLLRRAADFSDCVEILRIDFPPLRIEYLGYAEGLILFKWLNTSGLMLFNPSIRKFLVLPQSPPCDLDGFSLHFLVFDPRSNDHKVLQMQQLRGGSVVFVASYSLNTRRWEASSTQYTSNLEVGRDLFLPVTTKGLLHWNFYYGPAQQWPENFHIASFDFASDGDGFCCTEVPYDGSDGANKVIIPFVLGDSFAVFTVSYRRACIWVLNKCGGNSADSWNKWYDEPLDFDAYEIFEKYGYFVGDIVYAEEIGKLLFIMMREVKCYDLKTHMLEDLETPLRRDFVFRIVGPYRESLLLTEGVGLHSLVHSKFASTVADPMVNG